MLLSVALGIAGNDQPEYRLDGSLPVELGNLRAMSESRMLLPNCELFLNITNVDGRCFSCIVNLQHKRHWTIAYRNRFADWAS